MRIFKYLSLLSITLPTLAFANTGDNTFTPIYTTINQYLSGSLGNVILIICLLGALIALAGFANMKVMFPILVVAIAIRFGPSIIVSMAATSAELSNNFRGSLTTESGWFLATILLIAGTILNVNYKKQRPHTQLEQLSY